MTIRTESRITAFHFRMADAYAKALKAVANGATWSRAFDFPAEETK